MKRIVVAALAIVAGSQVPARATEPPGVSITHGWFGSGPNLPVFGFFTISNRETAPLLMTSWRSPACRSLHLDEAGGDGGGLSGITIAGKSRMAFVRGGYHLTCDGPTDAIKVGSTVPVTIGFRNGNSVTTAFQIRDISRQPLMTTRNVIAK